VCISTVYFHMRKAKKEETTRHVFRKRGVLFPEEEECLLIYNEACYNYDLPVIKPRITG